MRSVKTAELKDTLSSTLREVQRGARVIVTDRDRPIAMLVPIEDEEGVSVIPATRSFASVRDRRCPPIRMEVEVLDLLHVERGDR